MKKNNLIEEAYNNMYENTNIKYVNVLLGGNIGGEVIHSVKILKDKIIDKDETIFDTKDDAKTKTKHLNKLLSPGEKRYYGLKYVVAEIQDNKFTGK